MFRNTFNKYRDLERVKNSTFFQCFFTDFVFELFSVVIVLMDFGAARVVAVVAWNRSRARNHLFCNVWRAPI